jgi:hypothetical protein
MADVWVLLLILVFFAACVGLVRGLDRIIGGDDGVDTAEEPATEAREPEAVGVGR